MESFRDYFKKGSDKAGSGSKLGVALGTTGANITRIIAGNGGVGADLIIKLADYLGEDPGKILLLHEAEQCPEKALPYWKEVFRRYAGAAMIVIVTMGIFAEISAAAIGPERPNNVTEVYITGR